MSIDDVIEVTPGPRRGGRHRRRVAVGVVVTALVAAGGVVVWTAGRGGGTSGPGDAGPPAPACPGSVANPASPTLDLPLPVPTLPTASGVDGRLVPARSPSEVVLCAYQPPAHAGTGIARAEPATAPSAGTPTDPVPDTVTVETTIALSGAGTTTGDDDAVAPLVEALQEATVGAEQQSCPPTEYRDSAQYLVGLTYDDGTVWIANRAVCAGSTNGASTSATDVTAAFTTALATLPNPVTVPLPPGSVTPAPPAPGTVEPAPSGTAAPGDPGDPGVGGEPADPGRTTGPTTDPSVACRADDVGVAAGADAPLLAFTPTGVTVCHDPLVHPPTVGTADADVAVRLAAAIDALPTLAPDTACPAVGGETWQLLFSDDTGDRTSIAVDAGGCRTASNGIRTVQAGDEVFALLDTLS